MSAPREGDVWLRRSCALVVAAVAAYASYEHQRGFALAGGADPFGARLWPLSVDGLVLLTTDGLLRANRTTSSRRRQTLWAAFALGIAVSLAANIAAAPSLQWRPVLVAGWPPVALLLAVEMLTHRSIRRRTDPAQGRPAPPAPPVEAAETESLAAAETDAGASEPVITLARPAHRPGRNGRRTAETIMWGHYERERASGRTPTGAELDRVAGTNNYGRSVLARWRRVSRLADTGTDGAEPSRRP
jgi:Protein of unknown function (DUF2637)